MSQPARAKASTASEKIAALQPDLIGLQEVVYVMQQDRLIGAAGEGRYGAVRGWAGRPELRRPGRATGR